jgi:hypothetical protein
MQNVVETDASNHRLKTQRALPLRLTRKPRPPLNETAGSSEADYLTCVAFIAVANSPSHHQSALALDGARGQDSRDSGSLRIGDRSTEYSLPAPTRWSPPFPGSGYKVIGLTFDAVLGPAIRVHDRICS